MKTAEQLIEEIQTLINRGSISPSARVCLYDLDSKAFDIVIDYSHPCRNILYLDAEE
jgi:hypothetical protein